MVLRFCASSRHARARRWASPAVVAGQPAAPTSLPRTRRRAPGTINGRDRARHDGAPPADRARHDGAPPADRARAVHVHGGAEHALEVLPAADRSFGQRAAPVLVGPQHAQLVLHAGQQPAIRPNAATGAPGS